MHTRTLVRLFCAVALGAALSGCGGERLRASSDGGPGRAVPAVSGPQRVVEEYLKAASTADGARMYGLIASSERDNESPETLRKTAADRYSTDLSWEVLKAEESGDTAKVVVEVKQAKVEPNPTTFTLTRENGEWRIVDSPELHEREKRGGIHIDL
jgi:hypothetical protein